MLVLNRLVGESIVIDGCIEVVVADIQRIKGDKPRAAIGITAPREISVHRKEVQDAINKEKHLRAVPSLIG